VKIFVCPQCGHDVWFGNTECGSCGTQLAYRPGSDELGVAGSVCANRPTPERCNWEAPAVPAPSWCPSCALDTDHTATPLRGPFQEAKRRTVRQLHLMGIEPGRRTPELRFSLRESTPDEPVLTGHEDGLITLDVTESDPVVRERTRLELTEPYRTPLGHVRHELGHWWWATAIDGEGTDAFRELFGDEREPYAEALERHYAADDDGSWRPTHISHYAASHPWEDFAESFAHVLHILDTYETAVAHGLVSGDLGAGLGPLYEGWIRLSVALNELNRSMGTAEAYPFAVSAAARSKIEFVASSLGVPGGRTLSRSAPEREARE
jgi:hypothetical protein